MKRVIYLQQQPPQSVRVDGLEVFTPHRRAARAIGARYQTLDREAWHRLRRAGWEMATPVQRHRHLRAAVMEVKTTSDPTAAAARLGPAVETLLRTDTDPRKLLDDASDRVRQLAAVTLAYRERLHGEHLLDPAEALWRASRLQLPRKGILVHGYFRPRIDELAFIDMLAGDGSLLVLPCGEHSIFSENGEAVEFLRGQGWETVDADPDSMSIGERLAETFLTDEVHDHAVAYSFPSLEAEVRGVLAQVKELLAAGVPAEDIVLVAGDETRYGPMLPAVGWEYGVPVRVLYQTPLSQSRFGAWMRLMLEAVAGDFPFEPTAQLLKHPFSAGLEQERWRAARKAHTAGIENWTKAGMDLSQLAWPGEATRGEYVQLLEAALRERHPAMSDSDEAGYQALCEVTQTLHFDAPDEAVSIEAFAGDVRDLLALLTVSFQPEGEGVELHTPRVLFGSRYRYVFVLGMIEGAMPAPVTEDAILDFHERKRLAASGLRLESAAEMARREALSFYLMLGTATERVVFSYPRLDGNDAVIPSAYLRKLGVTVRASEELALPPASVEETRRQALRTESEMPGDEVWPHAVHSFSVEARRETAETYDEYDGVVGWPMNAAKRVWSASQLITLGQCPFKWLTRYVLGVEEPEEMPEELLPNIRGTLYHKALELAMADGLESDDPRKVALEQIGQAFLEAEKDEKNPLPKLPAWWAQRVEHIAILKRAIAAEDFIDAGSVVTATEPYFEGEWHGLKVRGFVDRVDRTPDGIVMVDYKTSSVVPAGAKDEEGRARLDLQIPIYISAAGKTLYPGEKVEGRYYSLTKGRTMRPARESEEGELRGFAEGIAQRLEEGNFPVDPDVDGKACEYCEYDLICRRGYRLDRKAGG